MGVRFKAAVVFSCALAIAGGAFAQSVQRPLANLDRQGRLIQNGVLFHFADPPRRAMEIGPVKVVMPHDGPEGEKDYPGEAYCERSMVLALTEMATIARDRGGDSVITVRTDADRPLEKVRTYLCDRGRVTVTGTIVSTR